MLAQARSATAQVDRRRGQAREWTGVDHVAAKPGLEKGHEELPGGELGVGQQVRGVGHRGQEDSASHGPVVKLDFRLSRDKRGHSVGDQVDFFLPPRTRG